MKTLILFALTVLVGAASNQMPHDGPAPDCQVIVCSGNSGN